MLKSHGLYGEGCIAVYAGNNVTKPFSFGSLQVGNDGQEAVMAAYRTNDIDIAPSYRRDLICFWLKVCHAFAA